MKLILSDKWDSRRGVAKNTDAINGFNKAIADTSLSLVGDNPCLGGYISE